LTDGFVIGEDGFEGARELVLAAAGAVVPRAQERPDVDFLGGRGG